MSKLNFHLFGNVQVTRGENDHSVIKIRPVVLVLLAYLLLFRHRTHRREALADLFWSDHGEGSRRCLNTTLWRLRAVLEDEPCTGEDYLTTTAMGEIGFNSKSNYWLDLAAFEENVNKGLRCSLGEVRSVEIESLENAVNLYTGDLLEGIYADWVLAERERLRSLYLRSLARLMVYHQQQKMYGRSLAYGQKILEIDPLREDIHRGMIQLYCESGQRTLGLRQYEMCREVLATEMGIVPMEETQALYNQLISGIETGSRVLSKDHEPVTLRQAVYQLNAAIFSLETLQEQLQQTLQAVLHSLEK